MRLDGILIEKEIEFSQTFNFSFDSNEYNENEAAPNNHTTLKNSTEAALTSNANNTH